MPIFYHISSGGFALALLGSQGHFSYPTTDQVTDWLPAHQKMYPSGNNGSNYPLLNHASNIFLCLNGDLSCQF